MALEAAVEVEDIQMGTDQTARMAVKTPLTIPTGMTTYGLATEDFGSFRFHFHPWRGWHSCTIRLLVWCSASVRHLFTFITHQLTLISSNSYGGSNGYSNGNVNGYSGGSAGWGSGGAGGYGGAGGSGDRMSNLGANLQKQNWGLYFSRLLIYR